MRHRALLGAVVLLVTGAVTAGPARAANEDDTGNVLHTGHCLTVSRSQPLRFLESRSGRFRMYLNPGQLQIENHVRSSTLPGAGYPTWTRSGNGGTGRTSSLCMQRDGNLVFRVDGATAWSSHTAGTGSHNVARMTDRGAFVVATPSGRWVWSSRTTAVLLIAGDRLPAGARLRNLTRPGGHTTLLMRRDGDLVLRRGTTRVWHTGTHVRGSYLVVTSATRLAVRTPGGRTVWRSRAVKAPAVVTVAQLGRLTLGRSSGHDCWVRPRTASRDCGKG
jgi:hypothetical protein